ncbi:threonine--tRNA ligase, cytoplasmic-like [Pocillopora damicornis]|uniref:threonine--tRNA ligase, cytoplasmic-like n=1 Tax=Pocillopora damicornis TaxID=46731 RepID=UPI000F54FB27|nr:threonine--tRNA ligase, cytoplasmic-like [Pocillopora damicornis]
MIRKLAVALRRQTTSTILKPRTTKIKDFYEDVFRHGKPLRLFCCCGSGPIRPTDDIVEYPLELNPPPAFLDERVKLFDRLKAEYDAKIEAKDKTPIKVTLRDGKVVDGQAWKTTPYDIASSISQGLADNTVVCKVNGEVFDLDRVLEGDCTLEFLKFEDDEAKAVFWHSSAHIMGEAMERHYGGYLCYGPPIEEGYYYDMFLDGRQVSSNDYPSLDSLTKSIVKEKQPFVRLELSKEDLLEMFKYNEFKCRIIREKVKTPTTTVYRCGPLIDLCRGPHVRHTGKIKAMTVTKNSATYWEGNCEAESLQRLYGISFPNEKQMKDWKKFQEEAAKRDHRKLGRDHELFFFHELSPGSCFFLPKGAHVYNTLINFLKEEYKKRGFQEVISPNIYSTKLWETSGHWQHYSENMFSFEVEKERYALKPMNCPGHCVMFDHRPRSWRELPLRMADFGVLHRNELSGTLTGLTRVRRFQQDDAHIFCRPDQIGEEIKGCLDFLKFVYNKFGFSFKLFLSTRPEKYMGKLELWDSAEKELERRLNEFGMAWKLNPGDGAFYGPKIDIQIQDALRRYHQCATIQLDFQLPERFNLTFVRYYLQYIIRPFWLSPTQAIVIPVSPKYEDYAVKVKTTVFSAGYQADVDLDHGTTLNKKIRNAQLAQYNFIFVVGEKEENSNTVNVRTRDNKVHGEKTVDEVLEKFAHLSKERIRDSEEEF